MSNPPNRWVLIVVIFDCFANFLPLTGAGSVHDVICKFQDGINKRAGLLLVSLFSSGNVRRTVAAAFYAGRALSARLGFAVEIADGFQSNNERLLFFGIKSGNG